MNMKTVVTIAGTDPTGGAGAQADLKTFMAHEVYGMSILTALVAQNTTGVTSIMNVTPKFLKEQFDCVFTDIRPDAVKIGMVSQPELIAVIVEKLKQYAVERIVVDPVMVSTSGSRLLEDTALELLQTKLLPLADIITPNDGYILIKGGHSMNRADDLLVHKDEAHWLSSEKIDNPNTHGTGCTLSSAIAGNLALGYDMISAVERAKAFISGALRDGLDLGQGSGPLNHCWNIKQKQPL